MARVIPGLALAAGWLLLLFFGTPLVFSIVIVVMALIGSKEYVRMVVKTHPEESKNLFLIPLLTLPVVSVTVFDVQGGMQLGLMASFISVTAYILFNYTKTQDIFRLFSQSMFGVVYVGCLFAFLLLIYLLPQGNLWLVILSAITAGSDTGAFVVGTKLGKHKLCPHISPNKTIEGAAGGVFFGVLFAVFFAKMLLPEVSILAIILASALLTIVSMTGDLVESIIKRGTGTKDSGTILAGHGGVLDRMDSMLFAAPFLYYLLVFVRGI